MRNFKDIKSNSGKLLKKNQLLRHYRLQYFSRWKDFEKRTKLCEYTQSPGEVMENMF